jgi:hypothetical protein
LSQLQGNDNAIPNLIETEASLQARNQKPLTADEQLQLRAVTQKRWAEDGYIILEDSTGMQQIAEAAGNELLSVRCVTDPQERSRQLQPLLYYVKFSHVGITDLQQLCHVTEGLEDQQV